MKNVFVNQITSFRISRTEATGVNFSTVKEGTPTTRYRKCYFLSYMTYNTSYFLVFPPF